MNPHVEPGPAAIPAALIFSPHLAHALLEQPTCVASVWPAFEDLRSAAHATKTSRLRPVISALVSEARLVFGACLLLARATPRPSACHHSPTGETLHGWTQALLAHGPALLPTMWHRSHEQCQLLHTQLIQLVSPAPLDSHGSHGPSRLTRLHSMEQHGPPVPGHDVRFPSRTSRRRPLGLSHRLHGISPRRLPLINGRFSPPRTTAARPVCLLTASSSPIPTTRMRSPPIRPRRHGGHSFLPRRWWRRRRYKPTYDRPPPPPWRRAAAAAAQTSLRPHSPRNGLTCITH